MSSQQPPAGENLGRGGVTIALMVMRALACSLEVFLHKSSSFGERYLGAQALVAGLIMFVFPALIPQEDPTAMLAFLCLYVLGLGMVGAGIAARKKRGELGPHTYYTGTPCIRLRISENTMKGAVEPILSVLAGALITELDPVLGTYLIVAGIGLLASVQLTLATERKRLLDLHDAHQEQRRVAEMWRTMRGE